MSDFDREAERERLREKYEQDREEREATERMSELLLQGATMTNAHCSECGDPVFRYDGQEFCAACERPVKRGNGTDTDDGTDESDGTGVEVTTPDDDTRVVFGGEDSEDGETAQTREQRGRPEGGTGRGQQQTGAERQVETGGHTGPTGDTGQPTPPEDTGQTADSRADIESARASLVRTLTAFSRRAEEANDPRRARDHLKTAREAAETLAAMRQ
jgi:Uncharacterized Zn-finger containing protein